MDQEFKVTPGFVCAVAYLRKFCGYSGNKSNFKYWVELTQDERDGWEAAAEAVVRMTKFAEYAAGQRDERSRQEMRNHDMGM